MIPIFQNISLWDNTWRWSSVELSAAVVASTNPSIPLHNCQIPTDAGNPKGRSVLYRSFFLFSRILIWHFYLFSVSAISEPSIQMAPSGVGWCAEESYAKRIPSERTSHLRQKWWECSHDEKTPKKLLCKCCSMVNGWFMVNGWRTKRFPSQWTATIPGLFSIILSIINQLNLNMVDHNL